VPTLAQSSPCKSSPSHALDSDAALGFLEAEIQRIAQLAVIADPAAPVPGCPDWTLADVVRHVGRLQTVAAGMVEHLDQQPQRGAVPAPVRVEEYGQWFSAGGAHLMQVLRDADPEAGMYSWAGVPKVSFWIRRMLHETTVHRLDVERAAGRVEPVDPAVAVDGVDEFLEILPYTAQFNPALRDLHGDGETIHLHATDLEARSLDGEWLITLEPHGFRWSHAHVKGAAAVHGPVAALLQFVYGRTRAGDPSLEVSGDSSLIAHWSSKTAF
jgi:uncharacterized protein (TIGR03083 family)